MVVKTTSLHIHGTCLEFEVAGYGRHLPFVNMAQLCNMFVNCTGLSLQDWSDRSHQWQGPAKTQICL